MTQKFSEPRTIGIVGGLGPFAGVDLVRKIIRWTKASRDQEHLPLMLYSFPGWIPDRSGFLLDRSLPNPGEAIGEIMARLAQSGAEVIGMPCNTAHSPLILGPALERLRASGPEVEFVSIIESAVAHVNKLCPQGGRIGLMGTLGTMRTRLYQDALEKAGHQPVTLDDAGCALIQQAISDQNFGVKACSDPVTPKARQLLLDAARRLIEEKQVSAVLLGCTEIPVAITEAVLWDTPVVDVTTVLAQELIRASCPERLRERLEA
ncbi:amino acid racemase [uncultured Mailhella sp.]|uniref:aspartate/glutamate racemase family protein n=1 Tax=uncultured Mailhella sp. TaxID=1981031 RepID=UPI0026116A0A|nr:amino acid racemase [uncultured Mailhella sp.]